MIFISLANDFTSAGAFNLDIRRIFMAEAVSSQELKSLRSEVEHLRRQNRQLKSSGGRPSRWRNWLAGILIILGLVAVVPASLLVWLNRTVTNTDNYVAAVGPVVQQPEVQAAIQQAAMQKIFNDDDVSAKVAQVLPDNAQFLADPITTGVKNVAGQTVSKVVVSQQFYQVWLTTNRSAQQLFMKAVNSKQTDPTIQLSDLYSFIATRLGDTKLAPLANRQLPPNIGNITIATVPALSSALQTVSTLETWRWVLVIAALGLLSIGVLTAANRRRSVGLIGLGLALTTVVSFLVLWISRNLVLHRIADPVYKAAASSIWHTVLNRFYIEAAIILMAGLVLGLVSYLLGPSRMAVWFRGRSQQRLSAWRHGLFPVAEQNGFFRTMQRYHSLVLWLLVALSVLAVILSIPLTFGSLVAILVVDLALLAVVEFIVIPTKSPA
jgi:hypothetical protein